MSQPYNYYVGNGVQTAFEFTQELNLKATVIGLVDYVEYSGTYDTGTGFFTFDVAPASGTDVHVVRSTDQSVMAATFPNKSYISSDNLDANNRQLINLGEENAWYYTTIGSSVAAAAASAAAAAASAAAAVVSAAAAAASAVSAAASAVAAALSETNAAASETAAAVSEAATAAIYDDFDDRYLGHKAVEPTLDNDGDALLTGALYFNTVTNKMYVYTGAAWDPLGKADASDISITDPLGIYTGTDVEAALQEVTTLATNQTISGAKSFTQDITVFKAAANLKLNASSANPGITLRENGTNRSNIYWDVTNDRLVMWALDDTGTTPQAQLHVTDTGKVNIAAGDFQIAGVDISTTYAQLAAANTFTADMLLQKATPSLILDASTGDAAIYIKDGTVNRFFIYNDNTSDVTVLRQFDRALPATSRAEIQLTELGKVNIGVGDLQIGGTDITALYARLGVANSFTADINTTADINFDVAAGQKELRFDSGGEISYYYGDAAGDVGLYDQSNARHVYKYDSSANTFTITPAVTLNGVTFNDNVILPDNVQMHWGSSSDLKIYHNGTSSATIQNITGAMNLSSPGGIIFNNHATFADNVELRLGGGTDLKIEHDATHSYVTNITGALKISSSTGGIELTGDITANDNIEAKTVTFGTETANSGASQTINWNTNQKQKTTISGATTLTFTAPAGPTNMVLKVINGGSGTITWPATVKWPAGVEPSWSAAGTDICSFYYDGTNYYGMAGLAFA